ncbi:MAG: hypothetical protein HZA00_02440 [Nitrospinae bacterium]|nr:hypothetical protein [Nitrospinota bacterium]
MPVVLVVSVVSVVLVLLVVLPPPPPPPLPHPVKKLITLIPPERAIADFPMVFRKSLLFE